MDPVQGNLRGLELAKRSLTQAKDATYLRILLGATPCAHSTIIEMTEPRLFRLLTLSRRDGALGPQPGNQIFFPASNCCIQGCQAVVPDPVQIGAACKQILRSFRLTSVAGAPECVGHFVGSGCGFRKMAPKPIHQPQRSRLPDRGTR